MRFVSPSKYIGKINSTTKEEFVDLKANRELVLIAVRQNGMALEYAHESLKTDREIVITAIEQNGRALKFADESLNTEPNITKFARYIMG